MPDEFTLGELPRYVGNHAGWDGLVHAVIACRGQSMKGEEYIDYQAPCFFIFEGKDLNIRLAILGRREPPLLCDEAPTCLQCIARRGAYETP